jgi:D-alanyl-D-alanine endopeptidase (penicillin-binding protein 7)
MLLAILLSAAILAAPGFVEYSEASRTPVAHGNHSQIKALKAPQNLVLHSASVLVKDQRTGEDIIKKQDGAVLPIASITKLMTAMVVLDAEMNLQEPLTIESQDVDIIRHSSSRLPVHTRIRRTDALLLALMSSENRAAHALGRTYPGGLGAFVEAMNAKSRSLGLGETHFVDATGISSGNVSSARDLARLVKAAYDYRLIRKFTICKNKLIRSGNRILRFRNTNNLIGNPQWQIGLSKTGFIDEAGRCLVMQSKVANRPVLIVLLDAQGKLSRYCDANRIKKWMEGSWVARQKYKG